MPHHLVGTPEIAEMLGVSRQRVMQIVQSYADFPRAEVKLTRGRVWSREAVEDWMAAHPERRAGQRTGPLRGTDALLKRFDSASQDALRVAEEHAQSAQNPVVGIDDLLVGLLRTAGPAAQALQAQRVTEAAVREVGLIPETSREDASEPPPMSRLLQRVLVRALGLAGTDDVRPGHMLEGLLHEADEQPKGGAHALVTGLGVDGDRLLRDIDSLEPAETSPSGFGAFAQHDLQNWLTRMGVIRSGDLHVTKNEMFTGILGGSITVSNGAHLRLVGVVNGDLIVEEGTTADINGIVGGDVHNEGGTVRVNGLVVGIVFRKGGSTTIGPHGFARLD